MSGDPGGDNRRVKAEPGGVGDNRRSARRPGQVRGPGSSIGRTPRPKSWRLPARKVSSGPRCRADSCRGHPAARMSGSPVPR